jgi:hypothetical protein
MLLMGGFVLPLLMVMHLLESTFFLNFFSFGISVAGMYLGLIGALQYVREHRRKR